VFVCCVSVVDNYLSISLTFFFSYLMLQFFVTLLFHFMFSQFDVFLLINSERRLIDDKHGPEAGTEQTDVQTDVQT